MVVSFETVGLDAVEQQKPLNVFWSPPSDMSSPVTNAVDGVTLVTEVVLTWGRVFLRQRTERPPEEGKSVRMKSLLLLLR
jgi:hypothetical protein